MKTMGEMHPALLLDPRHARLASREYPYPPIGHVEPADPSPDGSGGMVDPDVRDRVNACPERGPVLPISLQEDCDCRGKELSECRAGKGSIAGRVTLRECLACKA